MAPQATPLRTYTEVRDGKTYTVSVYPDYTPEQGRDDVADGLLNLRDGSMRDWQLAVREDLRESDIPLRATGDDPLLDLADASDPFKATIAGADARDDHAAMEEFIDKWGDTPERRAFLDALSVGHGIAEARRLSGFSVQRAQSFLDAIRRGGVRQAA